ncbi:MAG: hypothetical protein GY755_07785 [Chloroflexi bacterium]|nr:hypothetical protein [Chloroflexota bacterium]
MNIIKIHSHRRYFLIVFFFLSGCIPLPSKTIPHTEPTIENTKPVVVATPTSSNAKIPLPSGLILISKCTEINCGASIWIDNYDGKYWQFPFVGGGLRLSHNRKLAAFEKNGDIWLIDLISKRSKNLTNTPDFYEDSVTWSPDDNTIAFLGSRDRALDDVFMMDIVSGEQINITKTPSRYERCLGYSPCSFGWWSQEPSFIFTVSGEPEEVQLGIILKGHCHTYGGECSTFPIKISLDDKSYSILDEVNGVTHPPSLSPNGKILAYDGGVLYDLETDEQKVIYPSDYSLTVEASDDVGSPELVSPTWSPNGELIAWLGHTNAAGDIGLYVFDLEHNNGQLLTHHSPYYVTLTLPAWQRWSGNQITWSPDSQWITLSGTEWGEEGENAFLWIFSNDGKNKMKFNTGDYGMGTPVWSPDSKKLIFLELFYANTGRQPILQMISLVDWSVTEIETPEYLFIYPIGWFSP